MKTQIYNLDNKKITNNKIKLNQLLILSIIHKIREKLHLKKVKIVFFKNIITRFSKKIKFIQLLPLIIIEKDKMI